MSKKIINTSVSITERWRMEDPTYKPIAVLEFEDGSRSVQMPDGEILDSKALKKKIELMQKNLLEIEAKVSLFDETLNMIKRLKYHLEILERGKS